MAGVRLERVSIVHEVSSLPPLGFYTMVSHRCSSSGWRGWHDTAVDYDKVEGGLSECIVQPAARGSGVEASTRMARNDNLPILGILKYYSPNNNNNKTEGTGYLLTKGGREGKDSWEKRSIVEFPASLRGRMLLVVRLRSYWAKDRPVSTLDR